MQRISYAHKYAEGDVVNRDTRVQRGYGVKNVWLGQHPLEAQFKFY